METFITKTFDIPKLVGISGENIEEHLKLYKGYVTNTNLVINKINEYSKDQETNSYILGEMYRRFSFEFNGMRNHEYYFSSFSGGPKEINKNGTRAPGVPKPATASNKAVKLIAKRKKRISLEGWKQSREWLIFLINPTPCMVLKRKMAPKIIKKMSKVRKAAEVSDAKK